MIKSIKAVLAGVALLGSTAVMAEPITLVGTGSVIPVTVGGATFSAAIPAFAAVGTGMLIAVISTRGKDATLYIHPQVAASMGYKHTGPRGLVLKTDVERQLGITLD